MTPPIPAPAQADDGARYHVEDLRETAKRVGSHRAATNCLDAAAFIERQTAALANVRANAALFARERDAAYVERDAARAECARLREACTGQAAPAPSGVDLETQLDNFGKAANAAIDKAIAQRDEARAECAQLQAEIAAWRECARYDPLMSGRAFKGWDRSALDRCRRTYIEGRK
jgi:hypothetical protein